MYNSFLIFFTFRPRRAKLVGADGVEEEIDDHEEEFYYTEVELGETYSPPTLSHRDMARPPHEGIFICIIIVLFIYLLMQIIIFIKLKSNRKQ